MEEQQKAEERVTEEVLELRRRVAELEAAKRESQQAQDALRTEREKFQVLVEESPMGVAIIGRDGSYQYVNPKFVELFGYTLEDIPTGREWFAKAYPDWRYRRRAIAAWLDDLQESTRGQARPRTFTVRCKDGSEKAINFRAVTMESGDQFVVYEDITEQKQAEEEIRKLAYHDPLTGLPNRALFNDRLVVALANARRTKVPLAVMLLDLDRFKEVNDSLGHAVGDQLLRAVGQRLTSILRKGDTICRIGGDEFLLLLPGMARAEHAATVAERILQGIRNPFVLDGRELHVTTSLGIAVYPEDGVDGDTLIRNADIAMYGAKEAGRDNYQRSTPLRQRKPVRARETGEGEQCAQVERGV